MNNIKKLLKKYKDLIAYGFFGVCTTIINFVVYMICVHLNMDVMLASLIAWVLSVLFAFVTNRKWVFDSQADTPSGIFTELVKFSSGRVFTQILDMIILAIFVKLLDYNEAIVKLAANILVIILNYILSKFFVFNKKGTADR